MRIGDVIRKYRKISGMTQEDMANRLGVTTPAVNKWENNNTLPDVALLAPIARLLGITTDELLSFKNELTDEEVDRFLLQMQKDLEQKGYHDVFLSAKRMIQEHPNCESLIWQSAIILDTWLTSKNISDKEIYNDTILGWYERCLHSDNEQIRNQAADSLFHFYFNKEDYENALRYAEFFSRENPERKNKEALVYSKTGKREAAYKTYEELILSGYQHMQMTLSNLRILYMEDDDREMANKLAGISSALASAFEMGRYNEVCIGLDIAAWEKDVEKTAQIVRDILDNLETIDGFTRSKLYQHMDFKKADPEVVDTFRQELLKLLEDEAYSYMQGNECWESLKASDEES